MNRQPSAVLRSAAAAVIAVVVCFIGLKVDPACAQSASGTIHKDGEVTIITGRRANTIEVRSTRFRCRSCVGRVVDALKKESGISDVAIDDTSKPASLRMQVERSSAAPAQIGRAVKKALESDPFNTAPVEVKYVNLSSP